MAASAPACPRKTDMCARILLGLVASCWLAHAGGPNLFRHGDLKVSGNHRFLVFADGSPFFYLGDTAWELFHRLSREEAERYLANRQGKGFTVIQAVVLAELDGLNTPNANGDRPLIDNDPSKPNEAYFRHVDYIVKRAEDKGLFIGMLPTWGDKVVRRPGAQVIFDQGNARAWGRFLGQRYRSAPNIIWILGGDRTAQGYEIVWREMAQGLGEGDGGRHLKTFHPYGAKSSSEWLHNETWLDFNMIQSGHHLHDNPNYEMIRRDYEKVPVKPCMDGEPRYENHPVDWKPEEKGWFDEYDVRQAAYWAVFAGAHGHTYGCHDIWQMLAPGRQPVGHARGTWTSSLDLPAAGQMQHLRRLIESRPMLVRVPDQSLIAAGQEDGAAHIQATRGETYAFVYSPAGKPFHVNMGKIRDGRVAAARYDPRTGKSTPIGNYENAGTREFRPPGTPGRGNDWVLVLDTAK
jgi:hypothetical protein